MKSPKISISEIRGCREVKQITGPALTPEQWNAVLWRLLQTNRK